MQQGARRRIWAPFRHNWRILVLSISPSERYVGRWRGHSTTSPCSLACLTQTVRDPDAKREIVRCSTGALHPGQTSGTSSRTAAPATRSASPGPPGPAHLAYLARRSCRPSDRAAPSARAAFTYEDTSDECPEAVANFQYKDGYVWRSPPSPSPNQRTTAAAATAPKNSQTLCAERWSGSADPGCSPHQANNGCVRLWWCDACMC